MRIIHVAPPFLPIKQDMAYGGIERVISSLYNRQKAGGHDVKIIAPSDSTIPDLEPTEPSIGLDEFNKEYMRRDEINKMVKLKTRHNAKTVAAMGRLCNEDNTIFHIHYDHLAPFFPLMPMPFILTLHLPLDGFVVYGYTHKVPKHGKLVAISQSQKRIYESDGYSVADVIYNGLEPSSFEFSADKDDYLFSLSGIKHHKGQHIAIAAAKKAGLPLVIAGNIAEEDYFKERIMPHITHDLSAEKDKHSAYRKLPYGQKIVYVGPVSDLQKKPLYSHARAFLMPVLWDEPFGLVVIEALASGTPVIGLARGSIPELLAASVTGTACKSESDFAASLENLSSYDYAACRKLFDERFTADIMAAAYEKLYLSTAGTKIEF